jgi:hypothetical protein
VIYPTAVDLLRTIEATMVDKIEPSLSDLSGRSASATIRHLLRHVIARLQNEADLLRQDIESLSVLLADIRDYFASLEAAAGSLQAEMVGAVLDGRQGAEKCPTLEMLASQADRLRRCLYEALKQLQALRETESQDPRYAGIRAAVRGYLVSQIEQEERIIAPAFFGKGPRR